MVYGMFVWGEKRGLEPREILGMPFLQATLRRRRAALESWAVSRAGRKLKKQGVTQVVLPEGFGHRAALEKEGIFPVSTLALRSEIAADWVRSALTAQGTALAGAKVAVTAERLTPEVVRTVTELSLRHRYVLLSVPRGGETLSRRLYREYGVSLRLFPGNTEMDSAAAVVEFHQGTEGGRGLVLRLWDESQPLPPLALPPGQEEALPAGLDRGQLIAALRRGGAVKQVEVALHCHPERREGS